MIDIGDILESRKLIDEIYQKEMPKIRRMLDEIEKDVRIGIRISQKSENRREQYVYKNS